MGDPVNGLPVGDIQLYDYYVPPLEADTYTIKVTHTLGVNGASIPTTTQQFMVQGPRFSLDPTEVHAVFPAAGTSGQFGRILPHVVLTKRVMPWERLLPGQKPQVPWLALLLFSADELLDASQQSSTRVLASSVDDLLASDPQVLKPNLVGVSAAECQQTCQSIVISSTVFRAVVPNLRELTYLAHCRDINTGDRQVLGMQDDGRFAVVFGNRFPDTGRDGLGARNIAHLVSLEGYQDYLTDSPPAFPKQAAAGGDPTQDKRIRLVSLASWAFTCLPDSGQTFSGLVKHFVADEAGDPGRLLLRLPVTPPANPSATDPQTLAALRLVNGYAPFTYHTQTGEDSFAWYRGPLSAVPTAAVQKTGPYTSAAAAMVYDQAAGLFDLSLATAWQIGRSLAIADGSYATQLLALRRAGHQTADQIATRLGSRFNAAGDQADAASLLTTNPAHTALVEQLQGGATVQIQQLSRVAAPAPVPTTAPPAVAAPPPAQSGSVAHLKAVLARPDVQATLQQQAQPDLTPIVQWLARLNLLYGVPFQHLVPDVRLLPEESLRFFYLDQNWQNAALDGALSIGLQTSRDVQYTTTLYPQIQAAVQAATAALRGTLRGAPATPPAATAGPQPMAGILLRSAVVSGWPGLSVRAFQNQQALNPLRIDRLAPTVLLCIFQGVPDRVELSQPQETLHMGVDDTGALELRQLTGDVGKPLQQTFAIYDPQGGSLRTYLRPGTDRVLSISPAGGGGLVADLAAKLQVSSLGPAQFAIEMVNAPEQLIFVPKGG